jgi:AhpD family alkylhydroperoxidase
MQPNSPLAKQPRDALPSHMQRAFDEAEALHGDTTFISVFGNSPAAFDWYIERFYNEFFYSGRIPRPIAELVRLRLANLHGCAFCNRSDTKAALAAGVTQDQVDALADYERGPFSEPERAALALADVMALTNPAGMITPELYSRLRRHFSDGQLVELGVIMGVLSGMAKMVFAFDLVEKAEVCPL